MTWTPELIALAKAMWDEGEPVIAIGKAVGKSKNAVVSLRRRRGWPQRPSPIKRGSSAPKRLKATEWPPEPQETPSESNARKCQWPFGEPGTPGFHFCGKKCVRREDDRWYPYCQHHAAMAYLKHGGFKAQAEPERREKRAPRFGK